MLILSMDVDGYETKVIRGSMHTLEQYRPIMFFEVTSSILKAEGNDFIDLLNTLDRRVLRRRSPVNRSRTSKHILLKCLLASA
jgi:methyltransferase FkbM-like protein